MSNFMSNSDALEVFGAYAEDIKKGKGVIAVRETSPATAAHGVGEYIRYNGTTYKVKSAISIGDSLILNTNIEANGLPEGTTIFTPETITDPTVAFLNDLGDVGISNPQNGQVPMYNSTTSKFENANLPDGEAVFTITLTGDGDTTPYSVDKTPAEVEDALAAGKVVQMNDGSVLCYQGAMTVSTNKMYLFSIDNVVTNDLAAGHNVTLVAAASDLSAWTTINVSRHSVDISGKADKVSSATNGNLASLDSNGNLADSGKKASDFVLSSAVGTAAAKNVPTSGNASTTEVVMGNDTRLSDSRTPTAHSHSAADINAVSTLGAKVRANATAQETLGNPQVRDIWAQTTDLTPGTTALTTGTICVIYE